MAKRAVSLVRDRLSPVWLFGAAAFLLAGFIKGVIGLGLPTVSMGLLAVTMPPGQAIAIVRVHLHRHASRPYVVH